VKTKDAGTAARISRVPVTNLFISLSPYVEGKPYNTILALDELLVLATASDCVVPLSNLARVELIEQDLRSSLRVRYSAMHPTLGLGTQLL
jgi:hypothetical protein